MLTPPVLDFALALDAARSILRIAPSALKALAKKTLNRLHSAQLAVTMYTPCALSSGSRITLDLLRVSIAERPGLFLQRRKESSPTVTRKATLIWPRRLDFLASEVISQLQAPFCLRDPNEMSTLDTSTYHRDRYGHYAFEYEDEDDE